MCRTRRARRPAGPSSELPSHPILPPCGLRPLFRVGLVGLALTGSTGAGGESAFFEPLYSLPGAVHVHTTAYGVSQDGVVVGRALGPDGVTAFRWESGEMVALGDLPGGPHYSVARDVSADGSVIVGRGWTEEGIEAFRWEAGVMTALGALDGSASWRESKALVVSDDGHVIGGSSRDGSGGTAAVLWERGEMIQLTNALMPLHATTVYGLSHDGSVAVGLGNIGFGRSEGFRFEAGEAHGIGLPTGPGEQSYAWAVTPGGATILGGAHSLALGSWAVFAGDGELRPLDGLERAHAFSDDTRVVVGAQRWGDRSFATIWDASNGTRQVETVLGELGLDLGGIELLVANDVSGDGRTLVGGGTTPDGDFVGWIAFVPRACEDGLDNDGDGFVDHGDDLGCEDPDDPSEWTPSLFCDDGRDNDEDGHTDLADPECETTAEFSERVRGCGIGWELAPLLALTARLRVRPRPRRAP